MAQDDAQLMLDAASSAPEPVTAPSERVRVVLRIRPLLRREYGYPLVAEKLSSTRCVPCFTGHRVLAVLTVRARSLRLHSAKTEVLTGADTILDENATQEEARSAVKSLRRRSSPTDYCPSRSSPALTRWFAAHCLA